MKLISILFLLLGILVSVFSIYTRQYNALIISLLSFLMWYLTIPEKKEPDEPFRNTKTWNDGDV